MDISNRQLAKQYGYDESTVRQWIEKGMPTDTDANARSWIVENVITPLRNTDTKEQIEVERLRKMKAEAALSELELQKQIGTVVSTDYVEEILSAFLFQIKTTLRAIPTQVYLDLFAQNDAKDLRDSLQKSIDSTLYDLGNMEFELPEFITEDEDGQQKEINTGDIEITESDQTAEDSKDK